MRRLRRRSVWCGLGLSILFLFAPQSSAALDMSNRYRSPRSPERKVRTSTQLIVLHTTEAPERSSLNKVSDRGECHYAVTESGSIYRIVDRDREAFHAGRSMWNGREDVDKYSIGIECVGYHDKPMSSVQLAAIRALVKELQSMYHIPDERVVCHSHVAYGAPNRWHRYRHRGRKRCGMLFAMPSVRAKLGLSRRPAYDPDTRARRLKNADEYLSKVLYGNVDTMRGKSGPAPSGGLFSGLGKWFSNDTPASPAPKPAVASKPATPASPAPKPSPARITDPTSVSQLVAGGWVSMGTVTAENSASKLAGKKWNSPTTYYTIRNKVVPGSKIDAAHIEKGMRVWVKK